MTDVTVPNDLWEDDSEGAVSVWFVEEGDSVAAGDILCELMVEKSTFEIAAPAAGMVNLLVAAEEPVAKGAAIARIS